MKLLIIVTSLALVSAIQKDIRRLTPEDVGLVHTDAFEQLTDLYKDTDNLPKSKIELMMQVSEIMEGYCDEDDTSCRNLAYEATMKEFNNKRGRNPSEIAYPDNFHAGLKHGRARDAGFLRARLHSTCAPWAASHSCVPRRANTHAGRRWTSCGGAGGL